MSTSEFIRIQFANDKAAEMLQSACKYLCLRLSYGTNANIVEAWHILAECEASVRRENLRRT